MPPSSVVFIPFPSYAINVFEFDPAKSNANLAKHGIDFEHAQSLWLDDRRMVTPARFVSEARSTVVGTIGDKIWAAVVTNRHDVIRIISVRRARIREEAEYHDQDNQQ